ncbi:MAG TPA: methylglyoxal synthase [Rectinemataceae bacterium]|nr:methylglyoxal synthase [Rectinemataceae bacterium]
MNESKNIALVAHDNMKQDLVEWTEYNYHTLLRHSLVCTGTTGRLIDAAIRGKAKESLPADFKISFLKSGPLGGDQQLGAAIAEGKIDCVIFFWDPMSPHPHDVDVKALLRIAVLYNIPMACNRATADFLISSSILDKPYAPVVKDFSSYLERTMY